MCKQTGDEVVIEPRNEDKESEKRVDITSCADDGKELRIDVQITNKITKRLTHREAVSPFGHTRVKEAEKLRKHKVHNVPAKGRELFGAVFLSGGNYGEQVEQLFQKTFTRIAQKNKHTYSQVKKFWEHEISVALIKATAGETAMRLTRYKRAMRQSDIIAAYDQGMEVGEDEGDEENSEESGGFRGSSLSWTSPVEFDDGGTKEDEDEQTEGVGDTPA